MGSKSNPGTFYAIKGCCCITKQVQVYGLLNGCFGAGFTLT